MMVIVYLLYALYLYLGCIMLPIFVVGNSVLVIEDAGGMAAAIAVNAGRFLVLLLWFSTVSWIKAPFAEKNHGRICKSFKLSMAVALLVPVAWSWGSFSLFFWVLAVTWLCLFPLWCILGLVVRFQKFEF